MNDHMNEKGGCLRLLGWFLDIFFVLWLGVSIFTGNADPSDYLLAFGGIVLAIAEVFKWIKERR